MVMGEMRLRACCWCCRCCRASLLRCAAFCARCTASLHDRFTPGSLLLLTLSSRVPCRSPHQAASITPLAAVHTLGNALTNISLSSVAVSFTHTIKALEPMFSGRREI